VSADVDEIARMVDLARHVLRGSDNGLLAADLLEGAIDRFDALLVRLDEVVSVRLEEVVSASREVIETAARALLTPHGAIPLAVPPRPARGTPRPTAPLAREEVDATTCIDEWENSAL